MLRIRKIGFHARVVCLLSGFFFFANSNAETNLILSAANGERGTTVTANLKINSDVDLAGFNVDIVFPAGISVTNVSRGTLLTTSGVFSLEYLFNGQNLRVLAYSANDKFSGSGPLLSISIAIGIAAPLGLTQLEFSPTNPAPLINSQHAVSNADGRVSLAHGIATQSFLIYSNSSDFDGDTMPDKWEEENGLDPTEHNQDSDADGDGYTDVEEYNAGTDPQDSNSNPGGTSPEIIFDDGFEGN